MIPAAKPAPPPKKNALPDPFGRPKVAPLPTDRSDARSLARAKYSSCAHKADARAVFALAIYVAKPIHGSRGRS